MNFKTFLVTCVFSALSSFATNPTWTTPSKVSSIVLYRFKKGTA